MKDLSPISPFSECAQIETERAKATGRSLPAQKTRPGPESFSRHRRGTQVADCSGAVDSSFEVRVGRYSMKLRPSSPYNHEQNVRPLLHRYPRKPSYYSGIRT